MICSFKRHILAAGAALSLALSACGAQSGQQPSLTAPAGVSPSTAAIAPTAPGQSAAPTAYPAPAQATQVAEPTAYPAPQSPAPTIAEPTPPPATQPPLEQATSQIPGQAASCLPPDYPIVPPSTAVPTSGSVPAATPAPGRIAQSGVPRYGYRVVNAFPHDRAAFTEGLQYLDGVLYEGTGLNGKSELRRVALNTGEVQQRCTLPEAYFGEGATVLNGTIYQLTWQNHVGFVYEQGSFMYQRSFNYPSEGWGLTNDGQRLIMSDGTATIHFLDPRSLAETGHIDVHDQIGPITLINELEYVRGEIYANVWQTNLIVRIDPQNGQVLGWVDLGGLLSAEDRRTKVGVLNGIAYDAAGDRLFVTGKLWPKLFEIQLVPAP